MMVFFLGWASIAHNCGTGLQ
jgi:hypothetical protein